MKGSAPISEYFFIAGKIIVEALLLTFFTTQFIIPGINAAEAIESASLGNILATSINALSAQEEGEIRLDFSNELLVIAGIENKKNYIAVERDDKKIFLQAKLKNLVSKKTKSVVLKKPAAGDLIEVIAG